MCGRFTLTTPAELIAEAFGLDGPLALAPRYNVAPSQEVAVVRALPEGRRVLELLPWGFAAAGRGLLINARAESAATRSAFRDALRRRRCLLPADGFFEWMPEGRRKVPYLVRRRDGGLFAFAGLWDPGPAGRASCVILTTEPNDVVRPIHDRMPVILDPRDYGRWLDPAATDPSRAQQLLRPCPSEGLSAIAVSTLVNDASNDSPACLAPA